MYITTRTKPTSNPTLVGSAGGETERAPRRPKQGKRPCELQDHESPIRLAKRATRKRKNATSGVQWQVLLVYCWCIASVVLAHCHTLPSYFLLPITCYILILLTTYCLLLALLTTYYLLLLLTTYYLLLTTYYLLLTAYCLPPTTQYLVTTYF